MILNRNIDTKIGFVLIGMSVIFFFVTLSYGFYGLKQTEKKLNETYSQCRTADYLRSSQ